MGRAVTEVNRPYGTMGRGRARGLPVALIVVLALGGVLALWVGGTYNRLVGMDQQVRRQWAQVENVYQRRMDLVPNLVETVKGAANFEKSTFTEVAQARAQAGQVSAAGLNRVIDDPAAFERFQRAQDSLSGALSRLLVVSEQYPQLRATENFRDLQAQLEGTENRIAVERMRFNEAAETFNTARNRFPGVLVAGMFGNRFAEKPYFTARPGSDVAPKVQF
jgi:LemA protein